MDRITRSELESLAKPSDSLKVSLYVPLLTAPRRMSENVTCLRHAVEEAEARLQDLGIAKREVKSMLQPACDLEADGEFWRAPTAQGLAMLLSAEGSRMYQLPYGVPESVDVGRNYYLAPLMRLLTWPVEFHLLALSANKAQLFRCTRNEMELVELPAHAPHSLEEHLAGTEVGRAIRFQTAAGVGQGEPAIGLVHGQTSYRVDAKARLHEYVQKVAKHVAAAIGQSSIPLVLAAVRDLHPVFRNAYLGRHLAEPGVCGSPDELSDLELHAQALQAIEARPNGELRTVWERYRQAARTTKATERISEIVAAAHQGRVDSMIAAFGERVWGTWHPDTGHADITASRRPGQVDLLDLALQETLRHAGNVCVAPQQEVPDTAVAVAALRW